MSQDTPPKKHLQVLDGTSSEVSIPVKLIPTFPTGKDSISYSEISTWHGCAWKHKLRYIDKIDLEKKSDDILVGEIVHAYFEQYLRTRTIVTKREIVDFLVEEWSFLPDKEKIAMEAAKAEDMLDSHETIGGIVKAFPAWLEETFPGWEIVDAEEMLFENIHGITYKDEPVTIAFKGYIDAIIKVARNDGSGEYDYHIIDWKTTRYWSKEKRADFYTHLQLALYKMFWSKKHKIPMDNIHCHFGLVKKQNKKEWFELLTINIDQELMVRAVKTVRNMIISVLRGMLLKNKDNCKWCVYAKTPHCP